MLAGEAVHCSARDPEHLGDLGNDQSVIAVFEFFNDPARELASSGGEWGWSWQGISLRTVKSVIRRRPAIVRRVDLDALTCALLPGIGSNKSSKRFKRA